MKNLVKLFLFIAAAAITNISLAQDGKNIPNVETMKPGEIIKYLHDAASLSLDEQMENYFNTYKNVDSSKVNWSVIRNFSDNLGVRSPIFKYLLANRTKFYGIFTADYVDQIIREVYSAAMNRSLMDNIGFEPDTAGYKVLRAELITLKLPSADRLILGMDLSFCEITEDWQKFSKIAVLYIEGYHYDSYLSLNYCAQTFCENINDTECLTKALDWAKCSTELNASPSSIKTYTSLLQKLGRNVEADALIKAQKQ